MTIEGFEPFDARADVFMNLVFWEADCATAASMAYGIRNASAAKRIGTQKLARMRPIFDRLFVQAGITRQQIGRWVSDGTTAQKPIVRRDGSGNSQVCYDEDWVAQREAIFLAMRLIGVDSSDGIDGLEVFQSMKHGWYDWVLLELMETFVEFVNHGLIDGWRLGQDGQTIEPFGHASRLRTGDIATKKHPPAGCANPVEAGLARPESSVAVVA